MSDDWRRMLFEPIPVAADPLREAVDPASRHDQRRRSARLRDRGGRVRLNLTPMIDVVFQLLIFFVCTAQSLQGERIFRVDVPPMEPGRALETPAAPDPALLHEAPLRVRVRSAAPGEPGAPSIELAPRYASIDSVDSLHRFMSESLRRGGAGLFLPDQSIHIDPDRDCTWEDAVAAFNAVVRAGYRNVGFAGAREVATPPAEPRQ